MVAYKDVLRTRTDGIRDLERSRMVKRRKKKRRRRRKEGEEHEGENCFFFVLSFFMTSICRNEEMHPGRTGQVEGARGGRC